MAPCFASTSTRPASEAPAVLLPLDQFFEIRAIAAIRLWRGLTGRNPGPNPGALPKARRDRLILALRALDGRHEDATYREIAGVLFGSADAVRARLEKPRSPRSHDPPRALRSRHDAGRLSPFAALSISPPIVSTLASDLFRGS